MADANAQLQWSEVEWNKVRQVVYEEARRGRVAGNVLPLYGPLAPDARFVSKEQLKKPSSSTPGFNVADSDTLKLATLQTKVFLKGAQVADPELTSAMIAFRRAANVLARLEDGIVFRGQKGAGEGPDGMEKGLWEVLGGQKSGGLLDAGSANGVDGPSAEPGPDCANTLVRAVSEAIGDLEAKFHLGPFACILDQKYFNIAQTPTDSAMVLPQDRILPFLGGGPLLRSSVLPNDRGLVVALGGAPIDLVVATDITVDFLQVTTDPWFVFRVKEKIVLRINQLDAVVTITPPGARS